MGIGALVYADLRAFVNGAREIARRPARAIFWSIYVLALAISIFGRFVLPHGDGSDIAMRTDLFAGTAIAIFGLALAHGSRAAGLFASRAEARWIVGSPIAPPVATIYIQVRELARTGVRQMLAMAYFIIVYLPRQIGPALLVRDFVLCALTLLAIGAVPLPRRLAPRWMSPVCIAAGYAIMAAGLLPLLRTFAQRLPTPPRPPFDAVLAAIPAWHAGGALLEPLGPHSLVAFATVVAIAALALAALGFAARDRYPELYTISMERIDRAERMRTRRFGGFARSHDLPARVASAGPARVPGGPWVYVWSAWTSYRRTNAPAASAREALLEVGAGFVAARIIGAHLDAWIALGSTTFLMFAMVSVFSDMRLAHELRKPLFWLSGTTVFERLAALLVAGSWRLLAGIALISAGIAAGGAPPIVPLCVAGIGIPFALLLAATGFASYAILPHETDARGAMAALRILATFPAVVPALAVAGAAGFALQSAYAGVAGAAVGAILEAAIIVGLASWLLDRAAAPPLLADTGGTGRRGET